MPSGSGRSKAAVVLTTRGIETMPAEAAPYRVPDVRCPGLALRVSTTGGKTWDLTFRIKGTGVRRTSLGRFEDIGLSDARKRAEAILSAARQGRDLIRAEEDAKRAAAARLSVSELIDLYCRRRVRGRLKTAVEIEQRLKRALVTLESQKAETIRRRDLREVLDAVADRGLIREAEARRQVISTMFRWALSTDIVETNPADGLSSYSAAQPRDRVMSAAEIREFWDWLSSSGMRPHHIAAMKLQLCLGSRIGEIGGITTQEVDTSNWIWHLPAERSKNGAARATPLIGIARSIVRRQLELATSKYLFESESNGPVNASQIGGALIKRRDHCPLEHFTTHDLRRTTATTMAELGISLENIATVIGHSAATTTTGTLVRHYIHTDSLRIKREALAVWDQHLSKLIGPSNDELSDSNH